MRVRLTALLHTPRLRIAAVFVALSLAVGACLLRDWWCHRATAAVVYRIRPDIKVRLRLQDHQRVREFSDSDLRPQKYSHDLGIGPLSTQNHGLLTMTFWLSSRNGTPLSTGSIQLPLQEDWSWGIVLERSKADPVQFMFGCFGSKAFPLSPEYASEPDERIWVYWCGNSIRNPVTY